MKFSALKAERNIVSSYNFHISTFPLKHDLKIKFNFVHQILLIYRKLWHQEFKFMFKLKMLVNKSSKNIWEY